MPRALLHAVLAAAGLAAPLAGQRVELRGTVGAGYGLGGPEARHRAGAAAEVLLTARSRQGFVLGVAGGAQGAIAADDDCVLDAEGECLPDFPALASVGAVAGWEWRNGMRALGGMELFIHDENDRVLGLSGRLEARLLDAGVAPVATLRVVALPYYRGEALALVSLGVGLRVR